MQDVVILGAARTAIGTFGGALKDQQPTQLGAAVIAEAIRRAGIKPSDIQQTVMGNVTHSEPADMYISRVAALGAGISDSAPALTVNRLCGSGLQAILSGAQQIQLGICKTVVAGGAESMSRVPYHLPTARFGQRMGDAKAIDAMVGALTCPMNHVHMGVTAENLAERYSITRAEQDQLSVESHNRAERAIENGYFKQQIVPITLKTRRGEKQFDTDEHVRASCSLADMEGLKPVFKREGTVTAGNASGLNDAAAAIVMMSSSEAKQRNLKPLARLVDYSVVGVDPAYMGIGPVPAIREILERQGLTVEDIDLYEVNEAFAAQALAVAKELKLPMERLNPNGSGISLGHPIGATGAVIMTKALYELARINGRYAVISLCIGGGQGIAALIERS